jgi:myo-inositol 2-dehydrogenase/D-chiro-inositol 1-dehydrogenase
MLGVHGKGKLLILILIPQILKTRCAPGDVGFSFSSRQFQGYGSKPDGIRNRMFGSEGVLETKYGGDVLIRGKNAYSGGKSPGIYENNTIEPSVTSNLVTILGRTAAYEGSPVYWHQLMKEDVRFIPNLEGLKE